MCDLAADVGEICRRHRFTELGQPFIRLAAAVFDVTAHDLPIYSRAV